MYYARLRSSGEESSHCDSFIEWSASAPSENVLTPPTVAEIYAKIVEKTQSRRSPMPPNSGIPSETSVTVIHYAYPVQPSVPSQTAQSSSLSLSLLPAASGNSSPPRKKGDYCVSRPLQVYNRRHPGRQPSTPDSQASPISPGLPPIADSPFDDDRPIVIRKEKHNVGKPDRY
ncbi:hypothetical protein GIB67_039531 [Kingdonia uniflora]|uniref:Uncharacterized protein n=1 Tax=Kingdonia uniflora TaxID=39325 RepID=A0A7J7LIV5_9MAGN|nr:hypothetical protein GIB67_039531 [Kingdonia uniflora]